MNQQWDDVYYINPWQDGIGVVDVSRLATARHVIFDASQEPFDIIKNYYEFLIDYCAEHNITIEMILGSHASGNRELPGNVTVYNWPTYWIHEQCNRAFGELKKIVRQKNDHYRFPFVCLIGKGRPHRVELIDQLAKYDLIENNAISWHNPSIIDYRPRSRRIRNKTVAPPMFRYWEERLLQLTEVDYTPNTSLPPDPPVWGSCMHLHLGKHLGFNQTLPPDEYRFSFAQIVPETKSDLDFITEKTVIPLLYKKPFICFTNPHFHLTTFRDEMGFELYTEIFDYAFDAELDMPTRADMVAQEGAKVNSYSERDMIELYNLVLPKLEHNFHRAVDIGHDPVFIPNIVRELYSTDTYQNNTKMTYDYIMSNNKENFLRRFTK